MKTTFKIRANIKPVLKITLPIGLFFFLILTGIVFTFNIGISYLHIGFFTMICIFAPLIPELTNIGQFGAKITPSHVIINARMDRDKSLSLQSMLKMQAIKIEWDQIFGIIETKILLFQKCGYIYLSQNGETDAKEMKRVEIIFKRYEHMDELKKQLVQHATHAAILFDNISQTNLEYWNVDQAVCDELFKLPPMFQKKLLWVVYIGLGVVALLLFAMYMLIYVSHLS